MSVVLIIAAVWLALCAVLAVWVRGGPVADERHPVWTDDGWVLTLHRFLPPEGVQRRPIPLILGHGINMNRTAFELSRRGSLARALAARGHDVFVAEYRGEPTSKPPVRGERAGERWAYDLMDHPRHDVPAIIREARRIAGAPKVSWIGHSMGGVLIYLYVALHGDDALHRVVTLGCPMRMGRWPGRVLQTVQNFGSALVKRRDVVRVVPPTYLALPIIFAFPGLCISWNTNTRHITRREALALCTTAFEDVSAGVMRFFVEMQQEGKHLCPRPDEGVVGFETGGLEGMTAPLLVISGTKDGLAPPDIAEPAFHRAGSPTAAYLRLAGMGHCDLISGEVCLYRVLPVLADWLEGDEATIESPTLHRTPGAGPARAAG